MFFSSHTPMALLVPLFGALEAPGEAITGDDLQPG